MDVPQGVYRGHGDKYRVFRWRNLVISFIHSTITGSWSLACVILFGKLMLADMVVYVNWPMYAMCCFATGYFIYDTLDIVIARRMMEKWEILLHHFSVLTIAAYVITYAECVGYQTVGMLVEVNTVFLHRRQLFQLADKASRADRLVRANIYANLFTFVAFRIFPLAYLTYGIFYDGHRVPLWYLRFYATCMLSINIINAVLLYRLLRADIFCAEGTGKKQTYEIVGDINQNEIDGSKEADAGNSLHMNGIRLRDNVNHIMKHVVQTNVHS